MPCFRVGFAEKPGRTPGDEYKQHRAPACHPAGWVSSKARWWPRAYTVQWPRWHVAAWRDSNLVPLPCHLSGTTASEWHATLHNHLWYRGQRAPEPKSESIRVNLSSCLALFLPQLFFWKENESQWRPPRCRWVFQKGWSQEIKKRNLKKQRPPSRPWKQTEHPSHKI